MQLPLADALGRYLDLSSRQMAATASNVANVDTPGYQSVGVDVAGEFGRILQGQIAAGEAQPVPGLVARPDGNNVSVDREGLAMAKTQLEFRTGVDLLRHEFSRVMDAIKAEAK